MASSQPQRGWATSHKVISNKLLAGHLILIDVIFFLNELDIRYGRNICWEEYTDYLVPKCLCHYALNINSLALCVCCFLLCPQSLLFLAVSLTCPAKGTTNNISSSGHFVWCRLATCSLIRATELQVGNWGEYFYVLVVMVQWKT